jgi:hypothetical protein
MLVVVLVQWDGSAAEQTTSDFWVAQVATVAKKVAKAVAIHVERAEDLVPA